MNEIEIRVKSHDDTKPGFDKVRVEVSSLSKGLGGLSDKFSGVVASALALGPALVPVLAVGTAAAAGLATAVASSGAAVGVYGAVVKSAFTEVQEASKKSDGLREKMRLLKRESEIAPTSAMSAAYLKKLSAAQTEYNARLSLLPPETQKVVRSYDGLKSSWQDFVDKNKPAVYETMTKGMGGLGRGVGMLQPLFDVGAKYADKWTTSIVRFIDGGGLSKTVGFLTATAEPALEHFTSIAGHLAKTVGNLADGAVFSESGGLLGWLDKGAGSLEKWSGSSGGFSRFMDFIDANGDKVASLVEDMAKALFHIWQATSPLAPVSLALADALAKIISAIPPDILTALVAGYIAIAVATKVWAAAQVLLNIALDANPIGIIVLAVAALAIGLYEAYKHSETFRKIVQTGWRILVNAILGYVDLWLGALEGVLKAMGHLPGPLGAPFRKAAEAVEAARKKVHQLQDAINQTHGKTVFVGVNTNAGYTVRQIQTALAGLHDRTVVVNVVRAGNTGLGGYSTGGGYAHGGIIGAAGGGPRSRQTLVGEHGPELVDLAAGSRVRSNPDTERLLTGGGAATVVLQIDSGGSRLDDLLVELLRKSVRVRGGNVQLALGS